jgi:hypothetical protein
MTEAADVRPTIEPQKHPGVVHGRRAVVADTRGIGGLWDAYGVDRGIADVVDTLPSLMVGGALSRLNQHAPAGFDIDVELSQAPEAGIPEDFSEDLMTTEEPLLGEASAEDRRDEINAARDGAPTDEFDPYARLDGGDADADLVVAP